MQPIDRWNKRDKTAYYRAKDYIDAYLDDYYCGMPAARLLGILDPQDRKIIYLRHRGVPTPTEKFRRFVDVNTSVIKEAIMAVDDATAGELQALVMYSKEIWLKLTHHLDYQYTDALKLQLIQLQEGTLAPRDFFFSLIHDEV